MTSLTPRETLPDSARLLLSQIEARHGPPGADPLAPSLSSLSIQAHTASKDAPKSQSTIWKNICNLGRLRAAHNVFVGVCTKRLGFKDLEITLIGRDGGPWNGSQQPWPLERTMTIIPKPHTWMFERLKQRDAEFLLLQKKHLYVHAETQLILHLARLGIAAEDISQCYLGGSRQACVLCQMFLSSQGFRNRGCHGTIYPQWTVPRTTALKAHFAKSIAKSVRSVQDKVQVALQKTNEPSLNFFNQRPESVVGSHFGTISSSKTASSSSQKQDLPTLTQLLVSSLYCSSDTFPIHRCSQDLQEEPCDSRMEVSTFRTVSIPLTVALTGVPLTNISIANPSTTESSSNS